MTGTGMTEKLRNPLAAWPTNNNELRINTDMTKCDTILFEEIHEI